jgi:hypothetical protein
MTDRPIDGVHRALKALEKRDPYYPYGYNCDCQSGGVDATSVDADWLNQFIRNVRDAVAVLEDEVAELRAEVKN